MFGSQFRGRGPGQFTSPDVQRGRQSGGPPFGQQDMRSNQLNLRNGVSPFMQNSQQMHARRQVVSRGRNSFLPQRRQVSTGQTQRFQGQTRGFPGRTQRFQGGPFFGPQGRTQRFQSPPQDVILQEAHQQVPSSIGLNRDNEIAREWIQPASGLRGRTDANPEIIRRGFVRRFTELRQNGRQGQARTSVVPTRSSITSNAMINPRRIPIAGSPIVRIRSGLPQRHNPQAVNVRQPVPRVQQVVGPVVQTRTSVQHSNQKGNHRFVRPVQNPVNPLSAHVETKTSVQSVQSVPKSDSAASVVLKSSPTVLNVQVVPSLQERNMVSQVSVVDSVLQPAVGRGAKLAQSTEVVSGTHPVLSKNAETGLQAPRVAVVNSGQHKAQATVKVTADGLKTVVVSNGSLKAEATEVMDPKLAHAAIVASGSHLAQPILGTDSQLAPSSLLGAGQPAQPAVVEKGPTLEEDLQFIQSVLALLESASLTDVRAASLPRPWGHSGVVQATHPGYPGFLGPWGSPLGSAHLQELMFGDTTDPPDIIATTAVSPNSTAGNISEPSLNVSVVTAAIKTPTLEQIPAPKGEITTPSPEMLVTAEAPELTSTISEIVMTDKAISTENPAGDKQNRKTQTLTVEPLPGGLASTANKEKENGNKINLVKIISDALKTVSYPAALQEKLLNQLSSIISPNDMTNSTKNNPDKQPVDAMPVSKSEKEKRVPVTTQSPVEVEEVATTVPAIDDIVTYTSAPNDNVVSAKVPAAADLIKTKVPLEAEQVTTQIPLEADIVTDRLPTAADLGVVIKDIPIIDTTEAPVKASVKETPVVVIDDVSGLGSVQDYPGKKKTIDAKAVPIESRSKENNMIVVKDSMKAVIPETEPMYDVKQSSGRESIVVIRDGHVNGDKPNNDQPNKIDNGKLKVVPADTITELKPKETAVDKHSVKADIVATADAIASSKGKPALEIVLESLATQSGGGVEFLSRTVSAVDPAVINRLTAMPKLSGVNVPDVRKEFINPTIPSGQALKELKPETKLKAEVMTRNKPGETKADSLQTDSEIAKSANISKDSILKKIDLVSLAKELKLVSNGTDITTYLSDPLFVKVLEDIVNQTLSGANNASSKKQLSKREVTSTAVPVVVSTEEYEPPEIELDEMTTTSAPTTTAKPTRKQQTSKTPKNAKTRKSIKG